MIGTLVSVGLAVAGGMAWLAYNHPKAYFKLIPQFDYAVVVFFLLPTVVWSIALGNAEIKILALEERSLSDIRLAFDSLTPNIVWVFGGVMVFVLWGAFCALFEGMGIVKRKEPPANPDQEPPK